MVLKEEFIAWKSSELHKEFDNLIREKIGDLAAELVNRDAPDGYRDQYVRGAIQAFKGVLEWVPEFPPEEGEEEDDEV